MAITLENKKNTIVLNYNDTIHIFQKDDITIIKNGDIITFKDNKQKQNVKYSSIESPTTSNIEELIAKVLDWIDDGGSFSDTVELSSYMNDSYLNSILFELKTINKQLEKIRR